MEVKYELPDFRGKCILSSHAASSIESCLVAYGTDMVASRRENHNLSTKLDGLQIVSVFSTNLTTITCEVINKHKSHQTTRQLTEIRKAMCSGTSHQLPT